MKGFSKTAPKGESYSVRDMSELRISGRESLMDPAYTVLPGAYITSLFEWHK